MNNTTQTPQKCYTEISVTLNPGKKSPAVSTYPLRMLAEAEALIQLYISEEKDFTVTFS